MRKQYKLLDWLMTGLLVFMGAVLSISMWQIISPVPAYAVDCDHACGSSGGHACETGCDLCHSDSKHGDFNCKKH